MSRLSGIGSCGWLCLPLLTLATPGSAQAAFVPNYSPPAVFSNPTAVTNVYLPYRTLSQDVLEGTEEGRPARVVRTRMPGSRSFTYNGQQVATIIVVDSSFVNGNLVEVAHDYYAQSDHGDVYYFGEDVDNYKDGRIANHEGAWLFGTHTNTLGIMFPVAPKLGDRFNSEDVPGITGEHDEVVSVSETVTVPAGTFEHCVKVKEILTDGAVEYKLYAPGVGIVKELAADGVTSLESHAIQR